MSEPEPRPFRHGHCEAGSIWSAFALLPACDRRGRWLWHGSVLCGTCKRLAEEISRKERTSRSGRS